MNTTDFKEAVSAELVKTKATWDDLNQQIGRLQEQKATVESLLDKLSALLDSLGAENIDQFWRSPEEPLGKQLLQIVENKGEISIQEAIAELKQRGYDFKGVAPKRAIHMATIHHHQVKRMGDILFLIKKPKE